MYYAYSIFKCSIYKSFQCLEKHLATLKKHDSILGSENKDQQYKVRNQIYIFHYNEILKNMVKNFSLANDQMNEHMSKRDKNSTDDLHDIMEGLFENENINLKKNLKIHSGTQDVNHM